LADPLAGQAEGVAVIAVRLIGHVFQIFRRALLLQITDNLFDFLVRNKRPVDPANAPAAGHVKHVPLAQQLFATLLA